MRLSSRLQSLLDLCEPGQPVWDLCCDHGLLGMAALDSGKFPQVVFNDVVAHVVADLEEKLMTRKNARALLAPAEEIGEELTGNVVIAGVGGEKILKILISLAGRGRLRARNLILCPEKHAAWLGDQKVPGFRLESQNSIPHNHGTRRILHFVADTL